MAEGDYTLSAYTLFMSNTDEDFFFKKNIRIKSPFSINSKIETTSEQDGENIKLRLNYVDKKSGNNRRYEEAYITLPNGKEMKKGFNTQPINLKLERNDCEKGWILAKFNNYSKYIKIPSADSDVSVTFHPEGGYLIPNHECTTAFKAIGTDGISRNIEGKIVDNNGLEVAEFKTIHAGMGSFSFTPKLGTEYTAIFSHNSKEYQLPLPTANDKAATIQVKDIGSKVKLTPIGNLDDKCILIVQVRGNFVTAKNAGKGSAIILDKQEIPQGVAQALLIDGKGNKLSERLFFNIGKNCISSNIQTNKEEYSTREKASIKVNIGKRGNYAVSVTDNKATLPDSTTCILSSLLLQSDLKGFIESPSWYFSKSGTEKALDALMMTQGWKRYDIPNSLKGKYQYPQFPIEAGAVITGTVKSLWRNKPLANATVNAIAPKTSFASTSSTDRQGRFVIEGADFQDSTRYVFNAFNTKGKSEMNLSIDEPSYPKISALKTATYEYGSGKEKADTQLSRLQIDPRFRNILLDEITVSGFAKKSPEDVYQALAYKTMDYNAFREEGITDIDEYLRKIPGLGISDHHLIYRNVPVGVFIDGVYIEAISELSERAFSGLTQSQYMYSTETGLDRLREMPFDMIRRIDFLQPSTSIILGQNALGGALVVFTKRGKEGNGWKQPPELKMTMPLGYQKPAEFYSPKYTVEQQANPDGGDMRTTVYWNPCVTTDDSENSSFELFTTDIANTTYNIRIEGLTDSGGIISTDKTVVINN